MKNKNTAIAIMALLFLVTSVGQVKAATYYENSSQVVNLMNEFIYEPVVDLVALTGENFANTFNAFPPFGIALRGYYRGFAYVGQKAENSLGVLFYQTGKILAIIPNHLPNLHEVSQDSADFFASAISVFNGSGRHFKSAGDLLAIIPNNLPNLKEVRVDVRNVLLSSGAGVQTSVTVAADFFKETFNNVAEARLEQSYPYTQKLLSKTQTNLDHSFNEMLELPAGPDGSSGNLYVSYK